MSSTDYLLEHFAAKQTHISHRRGPGPEATRITDILQVAGNTNPDRSSCCPTSAGRVNNCWLTCHNSCEWWQWVTLMLKWITNQKELSHTEEEEDPTTLFCSTVQQLYQTRCSISQYLHIPYIFIPSFCIFISNVHIKQSSHQSTQRLAVWRAAIHCEQWKQYPGASLNSTEMSYCGATTWQKFNWSKFPWGSGSDDSWAFPPDSPT